MRKPFRKDKKSMEWFWKMLNIMELKISQGSAYVKFSDKITFMIVLSSARLLPSTTLKTTEMKSWQP